MKYISLALLVILLGLQYQIWFHNNGLKGQYTEMKLKAMQMDEQNRESRERNQALRAEVHDLKHGYEAVSEIARSQLHYIQAGETFYKIQ